MSGPHTSSTRLGCNQPPSLQKMKFFELINNQLNEQNKRDGGVLVICHGVKAPLDNSAAWKDLDVVKLLLSDDPWKCKFKIILAVVKGDRLDEGMLDKCKSIQEVYETIFERFDLYLPRSLVDKYLVTGWTSSSWDAENVIATATKMTDALQKAKLRIISADPNEAKQRVFAPSDQSRLQGEVCCGVPKCRFQTFMWLC